MAQVIILAREYSRRPSEIMGICNDYAAYCFDEVALLLLSRAMGKDGQLDWGRVRWREGKRRAGNKEFEQFVQQHSR